jgi:hypothetical protein
MVTKFGGKIQPFGADAGQNRVIEGLRAGGLERIQFLTYEHLKAETLGDGSYFL